MDCPICGGEVFDGECQVCGWLDGECAHEHVRQIGPDDWQCTDCGAVSA
jgi:hypothetical protein